MWSPFSRRSKKQLRSCSGNKTVPYFCSHFLFSLSPTPPLPPTHHLHTNAFHSLSLSLVFSRVRELNEWLILRPRSTLRGEKCCHFKAASHSLRVLWIPHASFPRQLTWICRRCSQGQCICCHSGYNASTQSSVSEVMLSISNTQTNTIWIPAKSPAINLSCMNLRSAPFGGGSFWCCYDGRLNTGWGVWRCTDVRHQWSFGLTYMMAAKKRRLVCLFPLPPKARKCPAVTERTFCSSLCSAHPTADGTWHRLLRVSSSHRDPTLCKWLEN